jgi:hypothetical protein
MQRLSTPQTPLPNVTYAAGRVTIMAGSVPIGAIGVSSAPGGHFDEAGNFDVAEELSQLRSSRPIPTSTLPRPIGCISG